MSDDSGEERIDPRFDPVFQRGFDPGRDPVRSANPSGRAAGPASPFSREGSRIGSPPQQAPSEPRVGDPAATLGEQTFRRPGSESPLSDAPRASALERPSGTPGPADGAGTGGRAAVIRDDPDAGGGSGMVGESADGPATSEETHDAPTSGAGRWITALAVVSVAAVVAGIIGVTTLSTQTPLRLALAASSASAAGQLAIELLSGPVLTVGVLGIAVTVGILVLRRRDTVAPADGTADAATVDRDPQVDRPGARPSGDPWQSR